MRKEAPGFVSNRMQEAVWREMFHLVNDGIATSGELDQAITDGPGLRWAIFGPAFVYFLQGGRGGMAHALAQFDPARIPDWSHNYYPEVTDELARRSTSRRGTRPGAVARGVGTAARRVPRARARGQAGGVRRMSEPQDHDAPGAGATPADASTAAVATTPVQGGRRDLSFLYDPASIAIVGASADESKWGGDLAARLLRAEHRRPVYFVNRKGGEIRGQVAYPSLSDLPEVPEMVVLAMPAAALEATLDEALALGSKAFVAIFAGLGETDDEGRERERAAVTRLRAAGAAMIGPNCMGLADHSTGLQAVAYVDVPQGHIGFVSQSGAMGEELVMRSRAYGCGFSRYVTLGNQADVGIAEVLWGMAEHEQTHVVAVYAEERREGREVARAAAAVVAAGKPVVLLAPGRSEASARAALSHTGSLAPDSAVVDAVCHAAGAARAATPRELFELTVGFLAGYRPRGRRVAIVTDAGGVGGIAADAAHDAGLEVPAFSDGLVARVQEALPGSAGSNPLDFAMGTIDPDAYERIVPVVAGSDEIDAVLGVGQLGYWGARFSHFEKLVEGEVTSARRAAEAARRAAKPFIVCTVYPDAPPAVALREAGVPVYRELASGVNVLAALVQAAAAEPPGVPELPDPAETDCCVWDCDYWAARRVLQEAGVPFPEASLVESLERAIMSAGAIGYPLVLKALGRLHKSDEGGVVLDIVDERALWVAYTQLSARLGEHRFSLERMAPLREGVEVIVGCRRDDRFGPLALVGLGGVYAELFNDVQTALAPVDEETAERLLLSLRGAQLFAGGRGRPPVDLRAAARAAAALSRFAAAHAEIAEVEINPLLVTADGALGLDARIVLVHGAQTSVAGPSDQGLEGI